MCYKYIYKYTHYIIVDIPTWRIILRSSELVPGQCPSEKVRRFTVADCCSMYINSNESSHSFLPLAIRRLIQAFPVVFPKQTRPFGGFRDRAASFHIRCDKQVPCAARKALAVSCAWLWQRDHCTVGCECKQQQHVRRIEDLINPPNQQVLRNHTGCNSVIWMFFGAGLMMIDGL